mgnify:CR=1 FL=1
MVPMTYYGGSEGESANFPWHKYCLWIRGALVFGKILGNLECGTQSDMENQEDFDEQLQFLEKIVQNVPEKHKSVVAHVKSQLEQQGAYIKLPDNQLRELYAAGVAYGKQRSPQVWEMLSGWAAGKGIDERIKGIVDSTAEAILSAAVPRRLIADKFTGNDIS